MPRHVRKGGKAPKRGGRPKGRVGRKRAGGRSHRLTTSTVPLANVVGDSRLREEQERCVGEELWFTSAGVDTGVTNYSFSLG